MIVVCSSYWNRWLIDPPLINSIRNTRKSSSNNSSSCKSKRIFSPWKKEMRINHEKCCTYFALVVLFRKDKSFFVKKMAVNYSKLKIVIPALVQAIASFSATFSKSCYVEWITKYHNYAARGLSYRDQSISRRIWNPAVLKQVSLHDPDHAGVSMDKVLEKLREESTGLPH